MGIGSGGEIDGQVIGGIGDVVEKFDSVMSVIDELIDEEEIADDRLDAGLFDEFALHGVLDRLANIELAARKAGEVVSWSQTTDEELSFVNDKTSGSDIEFEHGTSYLWVL